MSLLPCPHCGGIDIETCISIIEYEDKHVGYMRCDHCLARGPQLVVDYDESTPESFMLHLTELWNERQPDEIEVEEI